MIILVRLCRATYLRGLGTPTEISKRPVLSETIDSNGNEAEADQWSRLAAGLQPAALTMEANSLSAGLVTAWVGTLSIDLAALFIRVVCLSLMLMLVPAVFDTIRSGSSPALANG